ncbi:hypothetical protein [Phenylobacterium deserti]|uniref:Uncharacterized protein n=1 Tax=Phenylobacterium deserti TaxID=1914756 RepID=A0A328AD06_9CAUL|nr:hypothetical protein [Phenylobacterium deserti]RAK52096.1 hypothetical protein DJ018_13150 [Phenylobacterium deserti]
MNPLAQAATDFLSAYSSVRKRLPPHEVQIAPDGLCIRLRSGLDLLITHEAARQFREAQQEAEHG